MSVVYSIDCPAYPVQRGLSQMMRDTGAKTNNIDCIQAWAGQSARLAQNISATTITQNLWSKMRST